MGQSRLRDGDRFPLSLGSRTSTLEPRSAETSSPTPSQKGVQDYVVVFCPLITVWGHLRLSREKAPTNSPLQSGTHS